MSLSDADFGAIVADVLERLPAAFRAELDNVLICVDAWPSEAVMEETGAREPEELFGLYDGIPLTERGNEPELQPARVHIFREPLRVAFGDDRELLESEVRQTLLHELGHHFGLTDEQMDSLGIY